MNPSFMKQTDSRWSTKRYKTKDGGNPSVGGSGCGPTCIANVVNALIKPITPLEVFQYACKMGYMTGNNGTTWAGITAMLKHYGISKFKVTYKASEAKASLQKGHWLIGVVTKSRWTNGGHYILLYQINGSKVYVSDPASSLDYRQKDGTWSEFTKACNCAWYDIDPADYKKEVKKPVANTETVSLYTNNKKANVREKNNTNGKLIATLKQNQVLKLEAKLYGQWYKIASGKYKGKYIHKSNLSKYKTQTIKYKTLYAMNVREGYSTKTKVIGSVAKGKIITSTKQRGRWAYIPSKKGFVCIEAADGKAYLKVVK